ncbi:MAG: oligosaccharide flippase family protein [Christensenellaceae bacterium]
MTDSLQMKGTGMGKKVSFFGSAFYYTIGVVLAQGTTFITIMVLSRLMSTAQYGVISIYATWASIFGVVAGIQAFGAINNAKIDFGKEQVSAFTSASFGLGLASLLVLLGILFLFQGFFVSVMHFSFEMILLCVFQGFFSFCIMHLAQKYRILNKPIKFVIWTAIVAILRLVLSVALVVWLKNKQNEFFYYGDIYGSFLAYALVGIAAAIVILVKGKKIFDLKWWKYCFLICMPFVFSGLANLVLGQSDRLMLQWMSTPEQVGIYSFVYSIGMIATAVWTAFNNAWSVWYFDKTHAGEKLKIVELFKKYSLFVTLLSVAFILVAPDVVRILGGEQYAGGVYIIPLLTLGLYFLFLYTFPVAYETYKRRTVFIAIGTICAAALNIVLNLWLVPAYGAFGAAMSSFISYIMLFIFHFVIAKFVIKGFELSFMQLLIPALFVILSVAITYLAMDIWIVRWLAFGMCLVFSVKVFLKSRHILME